MQFNPVKQSQQTKGRLKGKGQERCACVQVVQVSMWCLSVQASASPSVSVWGQSETVFLRAGAGAVYEIRMAESGEGREGVTVLSEGQLERLADLVAARMAGNPVHHAQRDAQEGR